VQVGDKIKIKTYKNQLVQVENLEPFIEGILIEVKEDVVVYTVDGIGGQFTVNKESLITDEDQNVSR
tara:strand:+ start:3478 stop:3678 length:201 start_codon:yes stop_codon:yes gene_type:complete